MKARTIKALAKVRSIHLIDIENLCLESNPTEEHVALAKAAYIQKVKPGPNDHFFVTVSSKSNMAAADFGWGKASFGYR